MRIDTLSGEVIETGEPQQAPRSYALTNQLEPEAPLRNPAVMDAVKNALAGTLPRSRDLKDYEVQKLGPQHIQIIFDRALGYTPAELKVKYDMDSSYISRILKHPDAEFVLSVIISTMVDRVTDPAQRLQAHANEAVSEIVSVMRGSKNEGLRLKAAQDILSRAGYGEKRTLTVQTEATLSVPKEQAESLRSALDAAKRVRDIDYSKHIQTSPQGGDEVVPQAQAGPVVEVSGASPTARPAGEVAPEKDRRPQWAINDPPRLTSVADRDIGDERVA